MSDETVENDPPFFVTIFVWIMGIVLIGLVIWGVWTLGKNVSYGLFYADMVLQTVTETVKESCLIGK